MQRQHPGTAREGRRAGSPPAARSPHLTAVDVQHSDPKAPPAQRPRALTRPMGRLGRLPSAWWTGVGAVSVEGYGLGPRGSRTSGATCGTTGEKSDLVPAPTKAAKERGERVPARLVTARPSPAGRWWRAAGTEHPALNAAGANGSAGGAALRGEGNTGGGGSLPLPPCHGQRRLYGRRRRIDPN